VQKLKYIFLSTSDEANLYDFRLWSIDDFYADGYSITITFDYTGAVDADIEDFVRKIRSVCEEISQVVEKYPINPKGILDNKLSVWSHVGIFHLKYSYDEVCEINIDVRVEYGR
jgi:hypothetical protein